MKKSSASSLEHLIVSEENEIKRIYLTLFAILGDVYISLDVYVFTEYTFTIVLILSILSIGKIIVSTFTN